MSEQGSTIAEVLQLQFADLERQLNGSAGTAAHAVRKQAFARVKETGLPTRKNEEYKYLALTRELEKAFAGFVGNPELAPADIGKVELPGLKGSEIVFVNGVYNESLSNICEQAGVNIRINSLEQVLPAGVAANVNDTFAGLNLALATGGVSIEVSQNTIATEAVNIIHITNTEKGRVFASPRHRVTVAENAQAVITEIFIGSGQHCSFTNSVMETSIARKGILHHYKVGLDGNHDMRVDNTTCRQQENSILHTVNVGYGGKIVRNNLTIRLEGEYAEANLDGLYLPTAHGTLDNHTAVDHRVPHCNSNELYKGILGSNATGVFNGKVFVREGAQKTNAFQANKNILLDDTATINTKPQLEIWADDVKCSHGCTTGQMDKEQLFYLRARGIDEPSARKLLLKAFAEDVIKKIADDTLRARVAAVLEEKLAS